MNKRNYIDLGIIFLFIVLIVISIVFYIDVKKGNMECIQNPLIYGAKGIVKANNLNVSCSCQLLSNIEHPTLNFDASGSYLTSKSTTQPYKDLNISWDKYIK